MGLLLLPWVWRLDGRPHADWQQFLGRFHPAVVHLPIAILLLVPVFEIAGWIRPSLKEAAVVLLALALPAALAAMTLGYLLAHGSGTSGAGVHSHMWSGIWLTVGVIACLVVRPVWDKGGLPWSYPFLLLCVVVLTAWTGHQGGSLTYGKNYLTEYAPGVVKRMEGRKEVATTPPGGSFYTAHLYPVFEGNCLSCHGERIVKGGLRLDTYDALMKGGIHGAVVVAGKPEASELVRRITLPAKDPHAMPANGKPALKAEEIAWIKAWIADGASETAATVAGVTLPAAAQDKPLPQVGDYRKLSGEIERIAKGQGVQIVQVSRNPGDGLVLNTVDAGAGYGDQQLAQLGVIAPFIVEADLGRSGVTDAGFESLAKFQNLRALHLEDTAVTGKELGRLQGLSELTYLNLSGTKVTPAAMTTVYSMKHLQHVYVFNTPAQPAGSGVNDAAK